MEIIEKTCESCHYLEITRITPYCTKGLWKKKLEFDLITTGACKKWKKSTRRENALKIED